METEKQAKEYCNSCIRLEYNPPELLNSERPALNGVSRIPPNEYICKKCEKAEAYAEHNDMPLDQARLLIESGLIAW